MLNKSRKDYRILIVSINQQAVSETFIHSHIQELGKDCMYIYGVQGHYKTQDGKVLYQYGFVPRILQKFGFKFFKRNKHAGLQRFIRNNNLSLVLAEYGTVAVQVMPWCKAINIPLLVYFHGYDISVKEILLKLNEPYRLLVNYASHLFIVSKYMETMLLELGADCNKIILNPCFPNDKFFAIKPNYASNQFLFVGRMIEKKGPTLVLLAFAGVLKRFPEAKLIMIGEGFLLGACQWLATGLGIACSVTFRGELPHEETIHAFANAFCVVQHSVQASNGNKEGTPVALLEAGAAALPVVATIHAGIPEAVIHGKTGLLVDEGDVTSMTEHMCTLYADRQLAARMGAAAREHIYTNYRREKHMAILREQISNAI